MQYTAGNRIGGEAQPGGSDGAWRPQESRAQSSPFRSHLETHTLPSVRASPMRRCREGRRLLDEAWAQSCDCVLEKAGLGWRAMFPFKKASLQIPGCESQSEGLGLVLHTTGQSYCWISSLSKRTEAVFLDSVWSPVHSKCWMECYISVFLCFFYAFNLVSFFSGIYPAYADPPPPLKFDCISLSLPNST